jgi:hypothetical protein
MRPLAGILTVLTSAALCAAASVVIGAGSAQASVESAPPAPAPVAAPVAAAPAAAPCAPSARACFSVSQRKAWLTDGAGRVTYGPVPALGGTSSYPTPVGTFRVSFKDADHVSNLFNPGQMPNSVFFSPAIAFHQGSLSQRSHGCIHLSKSASTTFFRSLGSGDQVQVVR